MSSPQTPSPPLAGYHTKREAEHHFNRSLRAIGRDLTAALKVADHDFLQHCKLRTEDGRLLSGTEITLARLLPKLRGYAAWAR